MILHAFIALTFCITTSLLCSGCKDKDEITEIIEMSDNNKEDKPSVTPDTAAGTFKVVNVNTEEEMIISEDSSESLTALNGDKLKFDFIPKDSYKDSNFETTYSILIGNEEKEISGNGFTLSDLEPKKYKVSLKAKIKDEQTSASGSFYINVKEDTKYKVEFDFGTKGITYDVEISEDGDVKRDPLKIEGGKESKSPEYKADRNSKKVFVKVFLDGYLLDEIERELISEYSNTISIYLPTVYIVDIKSGERTYYMNVGNSKGTKQLTNYKEEEVYYSDVEWKSSDYFVATVDENGLIEAKHVGTAMVTAKGKYVDATFEIKVDPLYNTYREPLPLYGFSKSAVMYQETRSLVGDDDEQVIYEGYTGDFASKYYLSYRFDENEKVKDCVILIGKNYEEEVHKFLAERYNKQESVYFNEELIIGTGEKDDFMYVLYQKRE